MYAVNMLSRKQSCYSEKDWKQVSWVSQCLRKTLNSCLVFTGR